MQAIAGVWLRRPPELPSSPAQRCSAMLAASIGPAFEGSSACKQDEGVALGARATSPMPFLPEDLSGPQVLAELASSTLLTADLRLDNREELAAALDVARPMAAVLSDMEFLLRAWKAWEGGCVDRLLGGFAFACWDGRRQRLFLARDHAGEKALFFSDLPGLFAFASTPAAISALPEVGSRLDEARLRDFLAIIPEKGTRTFFNGIERLPPGHCLTATPEGHRLRRYWHPLNATPIRYRKDEDYVADFRERFDRAVQVRLRSTGAIGSHMSGGLDSSSVTAVAARLLAGRGETLYAYTAVPVQGTQRETLPGRFTDEAAAATQVAALYPNIRHLQVNTAGRDLFYAIECGSKLTAQPVFNPTNQLWVDAILDQAKAAGVRVMLQGAGGNATISLGGLIGLSKLARSGRWLILAKRVRALRANGHTSWRGGFSWAFDSLWPGWVRRLMHPELRQFNFEFTALHPAIAQQSGLRARAAAEFFGNSTSVEQLRRHLYEYYDPGPFNLAAAAGWGIENRDPTHDKRIFEFCYGIPIEQYLVGDQTRSLIRRAMDGTLPAAVLRRTDRGLQSADWYLTMGAARAQMAQELTKIERSPTAQRLLDLPRLRRLIETWPSQGYEQPAIYDSYHLALSRGLAAGHFIAEHDPELMQS